MFKPPNEGLKLGMLLGKRPGSVSLFGMLGVFTAEAFV